MTDRPDFDEIIDRVGTRSTKWDKMEALYGVPASRGLSMWVADMDFRPPAVVQDALREMLDHGIYGYASDDGSYHEAIIWWMRNRHGWDVASDEIFTTAGLVNGTAVCLQAFTQPGDAIVLMTPVYHAFARTILAAGREVRECEMAISDGKYTLDIGTWDQAMTGSEKLLLLCSPHNPGGRVWTAAELQQIADFAKRHDLILVSDEIHHDLVFPGQTHIPMAQVEGVRDRLIMMTATTKTFNLAGGNAGNVIIHDPVLRKQFATTLKGLGISGNAFGTRMAEAAYSLEGAQWVDDLMVYLDGNRQLFDKAIDAIPGARSMPLEATYLSWVDFSGTGLNQADIEARVFGEAMIAANQGPTFGQGGEGFLRFNLATPRARVEEAADRLQKAFGDLQ